VIGIAHLAEITSLHVTMHAAAAGQRNLVKMVPLPQVVWQAELVEEI
jgi:hypothetical protein